MPDSHEFFITCAKGVEDLLVRECNDLPESSRIEDVVQVTGGVSFSGNLQQAYAVCLWSRVASRVLLKLATFPVSHTDELYVGAKSIDWSTHMQSTDSFAVDCFTSHEHINNSHFAALKVKDAIVDRFRDNQSKRPDVARQQPDIRINTYIDRMQATVYLDLSGDALHKRGYRSSTGSAPLRESLAAAILYRCKWPQLAVDDNRPLVDCMCGSGTLLIEAAMIATHTAPGLRRTYFGFKRWRQHDEAVWNELIEQASSMVKAHNSIAEIRGYDISSKAIDIARQHIEASGFDDCITVAVADCTRELPALPQHKGLLVSNPPYGKRIGEPRQLKELYDKLGKQMKRQFAGWQAAIFTSEQELAHSIGLRAHHKNTLYNGALKCTLYQYRLHEYDGDVAQKPERHPNADMFANRLAKNIKHLGKWARKNNISCYRVYDADIPQYAVSIDIYDSDVQIFEYQAPKTVNTGKSLQRLSDVIDVVQEVLQVPRDNIVLKTRKKQSGSEQYTVQDDTQRFKVVIENNLKFYVNLHDYLDTGLFLDHRKTRELVASLATGEHFLNLFAYTGSFTVYAAAAGAASTTTIDMSNTYLDWAKNNLALNKLYSDKHQLIRDDCLHWLQQKSSQSGSGKMYDLIVLDPPTFSNSKRMEKTLDIGRDHVELISLTMKLLARQGTLIFSTNARRFKLDTVALADYEIDDISSQTLTEDYKRKPAHKCWSIRHLEEK